MYEVQKKETHLIVESAKKRKSASDKKRYLFYLSNELINRVDTATIGSRSACIEALVTYAIDVLEKEDKKIVFRN